MVTPNKDNQLELQKQKMLKNHLQARGINDPAVLQAMAEIPREEFIPEHLKSRAYADAPLPIGLGQTISQPYIVALMTQSLKLNKSSEVLELGTGSGYQTAILASIAKKVYTIERLNQLSESAQCILDRLGFKNIEFCIGDGSAGWPEQKLFDRIIITAAVPDIPSPLIDQLTDTGILVAPVGNKFEQDLIVCTKKQNELKCESVCPCRFVKLIGKHSFRE